MTPAGDRAAARAAVVAAGGIPGALGRRPAQGRARRRPRSRRVRRSPAVARAELAETSSPDAIISQGVALSGADGLQRAGRTGAGVTIAVLDQAFGAASRLDALAGTELPPLDRQHRLTFDQTYGLAGRDYNGNSSRHGEFVTEIVYDMAPGATYWFLNYHTPDEFGQAADYIANVLRPNIVVHSNSFLFGPLRRRGLVRAARSTRRPRRACSGSTRPATTATATGRGAWSDADADGNLDVPGDGNAFRVQLAATNRPACDISWEGATADPGSYYRLALYTDAALTVPALDRNTRPPDPVERPDRAARAARRHAARRARRRRARTTSAVRRVGTPPTTRLTLYCRMDLSPAARVDRLELPHAGRRARRVLGRARSTRRRCSPSRTRRRARPTTAASKPDIAAPTNVFITPGRSGVGRGQRAAAARRARRPTSAAPPRCSGARSPPPAAPGSVAQRVRDRLAAQALDIGAPGADTVFGAGPAAARPRRARSSARPSPAPDSLVRGTVALSLPLAEAGTLGLVQLTVDGVPLAATLAPGGIVQRDLADRRARRRARTSSRSRPPTRAATSRPTA